MKTYRIPRFWVFFFYLAAVSLLSACNFGAGPSVQAPTIDVTQAYQTVEARLTQAVAQTPTATTVVNIPTATAQLTPLPTATMPAGASPSPTAAAPSATAGTPCDQAGPGLPKIDITIDDDTVMDPGEAFTKTWRLQNIGTCTWKETYDLVFFSGEPLDAPAEIGLGEEVAPGESIDLSVDMKAPLNPGTYTSYWKLRNDAGTLFGIGPSGGSAFWVRIVVQSSSTPAATSGTPTPGPTPTASPTPQVMVNGTANLSAGDTLDMDTNQKNAGSEDWLYRVEGQTHSLVPQNTAFSAYFGGVQPSMQDCQTLTLSADPLVVNELPVGGYICYRTNLALPGFARIAAFNAASSALTLEIITWTVP